MKRYKLTLLMVVFSLWLVGCSSEAPVKEAEKVTIQKKEVEAVTSMTKAEEVVVEVQMAVTDDLKERAAKEGVSVDELQDILSQLTALTAEKYGDTVEGYMDQLTSEGKTPLDEFGPVADMMEISLVDYQSYEQSSMANLSDEEKEVMAGMAGALDEINDMDLNGGDDAAKAALEAIGGMAGDRVVTGNYRELGLYEVKEIIEEDTTSEGSEGITLLEWITLMLATLAWRLLVVTMWKFTLPQIRMWQVT